MLSSCKGKSLIYESIGKLSGQLCALAAQSVVKKNEIKGRAHIECGRRSLRPALQLERSLRLDSCDFGREERNASESQSHGGKPPPGAISMTGG